MSGDCSTANHQDLSMGQQAQGPNQKSISITISDFNCQGLDCATCASRGHLSAHAMRRRSAVSPRPSWGTGALTCKGLFSSIHPTWTSDKNMDYLCLSTNICLKPHSSPKGFYNIQRDIEWPSPKKWDHIAQTAECQFSVVRPSVIQGEELLHCFPRHLWTFRHGWHWCSDKCRVSGISLKQWEDTERNQVHIGEAQILTHVTWARAATDWNMLHLPRSAIGCPSPSARILRLTCSKRQGMRPHQSSQSVQFLDRGDLGVVFQPLSTLDRICRWTCEGEPTWAQSIGNQPCRHQWRFASKKAPHRPVTNSSNSRLGVNVRQWNHVTCVHITLPSSFGVPSWPVTFSFFQPKDCPGAKQDESTTGASMEVQWLASAWWHAMNLLQKSNITQIHIKITFCFRKLVLGLTLTFGMAFSHILPTCSDTRKSTTGATLARAWCRLGKELLTTNQKTWVSSETFYLSRQYLVSNSLCPRSLEDLLVSVVQDPISERWNKNDTLLHAAHPTSWRKTPAGHMVF